MKNLPPPTFVDTARSVYDELPDYIAGHIIYREEENGMPWVIYDGNEKHHFATRRAAARFAMERAAKVTDKTAAQVLTIASVCRDLSDRLGRIYLPYHAETTRQLAASAAKLRGISDYVYAIGQYCQSASQGKSTITDDI